MDAWGLAYLCVGHFLTNFSKFSLRNANCFLHNFHIILWIQIFKNSEVKAKIWIVAVLSFMFSRLCLKLFKTMEQQVTWNLLSQMVHYYSLVHNDLQNSAFWVQSEVFLKLASKRYLLKKRASCSIGHLWKF
jgi:hypothetical protein